MAKTELGKLRLDGSNAKPFGDGLHLITANGWAAVLIPTDAASVKAAAPSSTGKTRMVGTTRGFLGIGGTDVKVSINATTPMQPGTEQPGVQG